MTALKKGVGKHKRKMSEFVEGLEREGKGRSGGNLDTTLKKAKQEERSDRKP